MSSNGLLQTLAMFLAIASENTYLRPHDTLTSAVAQDAVMSDAAMFINPVSKPVRGISRDYFLTHGGPSVDQGNLGWYSSRNRIVTYRHDTGFTQTSMRSPRFEALSLYLSRLVRPIWRSRVTSGLA